MSHKTIYTIVGVALVSLLIVMFATFDNRRNDEKAHKLATELLQEYKAAGIESRLGVDQLSNTLGDNGGAVCSAAHNLTKSDSYRGYIKLQNGVGGEFYFRPSDLDSGALKRAKIVVKVYCPDQIPGLKKLLGGLKTSDVIKN